MKKKRKIVLHDPRLKNIRTQMRMLVGSAVLREIMRLNSLCSDLIMKNKDFMSYHSKSEKLSHTLDHSVIRCCICRKSDKDMRFSPFSEQWACDDCVEILKEGYDMVISLQRQGKSIGDYNIEFLEGFLEDQ